MIFEAMFRSRR